MPATLKINGLRALCWPKDFLAQLAAHPEVESIRARRQTGSLIVEYVSGISEVYWYGPAQSKQRTFSIAPSECQISRVPPVYDQYPGGLGEPSPHPAHLTINRSDWVHRQPDRASAGRAGVYTRSEHPWLDHAHGATGGPGAGFLAGRYPANIRLDGSLSLRWLLHFYTKAQSGRGPADFPNLGRAGSDLHKLGAPGWAITLHFWDISEWLQLTWVSPKRLYVLTRKILGRADGLLNTTEMIRHALRWYGGGLGSFSSGASLVLLSELEPGSTVYDRYRARTGR